MWILVGLLVLFTAAIVITVIGTEKTGEESDFPFD